MSELHHKSLSVDCPTCRAPRMVECNAPRKQPGVSHVARTARGVRTAWRGDAEQHERAFQALQRAKRMGPRATGSDIVTAMACVCGECGGVRNLLRICDELAAAGVVL